MFGALARLESASRSIRAVLTGGAALALHTGVLAFAPVSAPSDSSTEREDLALDVIAITVAGPFREPTEPASTLPEPSARQSSRTALKVSAGANRPAASAEKGSPVSAAPPLLQAAESPDGDGLPVSSTDAVSPGATRVSSASGARGAGDLAHTGGGGGGASGPRLLAHGNPCAGYFPASAPGTLGRVRLNVDVSADGFVAKSKIVSVTPSHSGFLQAAIACSSRLRFAPARTELGQAVRSRTTLLLSFTRD